MSSKKEKKSLQNVSGLRLARIIDEKVTHLDDFARTIGYTRQYVNKLGKKEKVKIPDEKLEKLKSYLNITFDEIKYVPRETERKQKGTTLSVYPVSSSILDELENCRKDLDYWKGLAREYEQELLKLRRNQK